MMRKTSDNLVNKKLIKKTYNVIIHIYRVFANRPGDLGSIPSQILSKIKKMVLDATLPNIQYYKVLSRLVSWLVGFYGISTFVGY